MEWKPRNKRLFVFAVPKKNKFKGSSLYCSKPLSGAYTQAADIWVISAAEDCIEKWEPGTHCLITDGFELEPVYLDMWEEFKDKPEFAKLKAFVQEVDGEVETQLVAEGSILGIVEE